MIKKLKSGTWLIETPVIRYPGRICSILAVKKNLVILSMHRKDKKLEDVFRELTS